MTDPDAPADRARTCGARIPVAASVRRDAYDQARGVPGLARASLPCVLAVHTADVDHAALARPLHRPQGGAVWAHWEQTAAVSCTARKDCTLGEQQPCSLFAGHPGPCPETPNVLAEDETRALRIGRAREVLEDYGAYDAETLAVAGHDVLLLAWDEMRARDIWNRMPSWDQAAVHRTVTAAPATPATLDAAYVNRLVAGHDQLALLLDTGGLPGGETAAQLAAELAELPSGWQAVVLGQQREPRHDSKTPRTPLDEAVQTAADRFAAGQTPTPAAPRWRTDWDDEDDRKRGAHAAGGLARLPYGWRVDAVRRITHGLSALAAVHDAALARNMLRGHGIDIQRNHRPGADVD